MFNVGLYGLYSLKFDISIECLRFCLNCEFAINIFSIWIVEFRNINTQK